MSSSSEESASLCDLEVEAEDGGTVLVIAGRASPSWRYRPFAVRSSPGLQRCVACTHLDTKSLPKTQFVIRVG